MHTHTYTPTHMYNLYNFYQSVIVHMSATRNMIKSINGRLTVNAVTENAKGAKGQYQSQISGLHDMLVTQT